MPTVNKGAVTINTINKTSITSTNGVTFISLIKEYLLLRLIFLLLEIVNFYLFSNCRKKIVVNSSINDSNEIKYFDKSLVILL